MTVSTPDKLEFKPKGITRKEKYYFKMISQFIKKLQQLKFVNNKPQNTEKLKKNTRTERYIAIITVEILTYISQYLIK